ncbi:MAG: hypothetical protein R3E44_09620 [Paracoccaceae bacterium]
MSPAFPFQTGGAAAEFATLLGDHAGLCITDRTAWPRFGLKGPGSTGWLEGAGISLPGLNRVAAQADLLVLRLGDNDITVLGSSETLNGISSLRVRWEAAAGPKGYSSWREEAWAWLHLDGPELDQTLARCCAVDLRLGRFAADQIAQTRFAHVDAVVLRRDGGADILFDIAASSAVIKIIRESGGHP